MKRYKLQDRKFNTTTYYSNIQLWLAFIIQFILGFCFKIIIG